MISYDDWEVLWEDTFSSGLNTQETWTIETGDSWQYGFPLWGNSEKQFYTSENIQVTKDGVLRITAKYQRMDARLESDCWDECYRRCVRAGKKPGTDDFDYCMDGCGNTGNRCKNVGLVGISSGRMYTKGPVPRPSSEYPYIRIESRIKMSDDGLGLWPAFWMLPWINTSDIPGEGEYGRWPLSGEIDVLESANALNFVNGSVHFGGSLEHGMHRMASVSKSLNQSMVETYHTFGIEWNNDMIRWYVDDAYYGQVLSKTWWTMSDLDDPIAPFDKDFRIVLNLAVGGVYPEDNAGRSITVKELQKTLETPKSMEIDSVTIWGLAKRYT